MTTDELLWNAAFEQEPEQDKIEEDMDIDYTSLFEKFGDYFKPQNIQI